MSISSHIASQYPGCRPEDLDTRRQSLDPWRRLVDAERYYCYDSSRALLAACQVLGLDTQGLLEEAGLDPEEVDNPDGRLPGAAVATLFRQALVRSGDPDLPLRAAAAVPFGA